MTYFSREVDDRTLGLITLTHVSGRERELFSTPSSGQAKGNLTDRTHQMYATLEVILFVPARVDRHRLRSCYPGKSERLTELPKISRPAPIKSMFCGAIADATRSGRWGVGVRACWGSLRLGDWGYT